MYYSKELKKFKQINHCFFSRKNGFSKGVYKGLNCGRGSKDSKKNMSSFLNELGNPYYAIVDDKDGYQSIKLGAFGVPETFLIDKKKNIVLKQIGPIDDNIYFKFLAILKK